MWKLVARLRTVVAIASLCVPVLIGSQNAVAQNVGQSATDAEKPPPVSRGDRLPYPVPYFTQDPVITPPEQIAYGESFTVTMTVANYGEHDSDEGAICVSFRDTEGPCEAIVERLGSHYGDFICSDAGDPIHNSDCEEVDALYLTWEEVDWDWPSGELRTLQLRVTPKSIGNFRVYVRSTMRDELAPPGDCDAYYNGWPSNGYLVTDQQTGWDVKMYWVWY